MCVKSKSTRAVASEVPLSKHGDRVAARLFFLRHDLLSHFCDLLIEEITTLDERLDFMNLKYPFFWRLYVSMISLPCGK